MEFYKCNSVMWILRKYICNLPYFIDFLMDVVLCDNYVKYKIK